VSRAGAAPDAGSPVTVPWSRKPGAGAPLHFRAAHGLWQISAPDPREGSVELGYVRQDARGRLPGVPLPIGVFSSAAEAMLAVELYEAALAGEAVPGVPTGKGGAARVLADGSDLVIEKTEADLLLVGERPDGVRSTIARLHRPGPRGEDGFGAFERPPGIEDPAGIDAAILGAIAGVRTARRGRGGAALQPVTEEEFRAWQEARGAGDAEGGHPRRR
jgi:hypothetical protein